LEAIETKEPVSINQVSLNQFSNSDCTYYQSMNYVFEECPIFYAQQIYLNPMNATFSRSTTILMLKHTILAGEITRISMEPKH